LGKNINGWNAWGKQQRRGPKPTRTKGGGKNLAREVQFHSGESGLTGQERRGKEIGVIERDWAGVGERDAVTRFGL